MPAALWQLRADARNGLLALETRDPDRLAVSFWVLNTGSGILELENYKPQELWWVGLEGIQDNVIYLHGYGKDGFGQHLGITAFDFHLKKNTWVQANQQFYGLSQNSVLVQDPRGSLEMVNVLEPLTGALITGTITVPEARNKLLQYEQEVQYFWQIPVKYQAGHVYFEAVQQFIMHKTGKVAHLTIDYLEWQKYIIIGFYQALSEDKTNYEFLIFTDAGNLLTQMVLDDSQAGNSPDTFFIIMDTLILLKNKQSLVGFRL